MDKVEEVARAIASTNIQFGSDDPVGKVMEDHSWQFHVGAARAAIAAMREPNKAMIRAGSDTSLGLWDDYNNQTVGVTLSGEVWDNMLSAALGGNTDAA